MAGVYPGIGEAQEAALSTEQTELSGKVVVADPQPKMPRPEKGKRRGRRGRRNKGRQKVKGEGGGGGGRRRGRERESKESKVPIWNVGSVARTDGGSIRRR